MVRRSGPRGGYLGAGGPGAVRGAESPGAVHGAERGSELSVVLNWTGAVSGVWPLSVVLNKPPPGLCPWC